MIALHDKGLPVFGITHPAIAPGRGRGPNAAPIAEAPPPPMPSLMDAARETVAYPHADFAYDNYAPATAERFLGYMGAMLAAGGSVRQHAFISKVPIIHTDPAVATARIVEQLNAGHAGVMLQEVESADEVRAGLAAMRFKSKGGTRPDDGVGLAAVYWKLSEDEYRRKADPWPLNKDGELVLWAIVESKKGIANIREIAQVPGLTVIVVGAGTLGGVFSSTGAGRPAGARSGWLRCRRKRHPRRLQGVQGALQPSGQQPRRDRGADGARLHRVHDAGAQPGGLRRDRCRAQAGGPATAADDVARLRATVGTARAERFLPPDRLAPRVTM